MPSLTRALRTLSALFALAFASLALAGCAGPTPPKDSPAVYAYIPGHSPIYQNQPGTNSADVILLTVFYGHDRYYKNHTNDTDVAWELELFAVTKVEKGAWYVPDLSFLVYDTGDMTPEKIRKWPYRNGIVMRFWLNTSTRPVKIVGQQALNGPYGHI
jgi:hypothetical protein